MALAFLINSSSPSEIARQPALEPAEHISGKTEGGSGDGSRKAGNQAGPPGQESQGGMIELLEINIFAAHFGHACCQLGIAEGALQSR